MEVAQTVVFTLEKGLTIQDGNGLPNLNFPWDVGAMYVPVWVQLRIRG